MVSVTTYGHLCLSVLNVGFFWRGRCGGEIIHGTFQRLLESCFRNVNNFNLCVNKLRSCQYSNALTCGPVTAPLSQEQILQCRHFVVAVKAVTRLVENGTTFWIASLIKVIVFY